MDQVNRLQLEEGGGVGGGGGGGSATGNGVSPHHRRTQSFLQDSLKRSIDLPAYLHWQTLSSEVSHRLRQGSIRINYSNQVEWAPSIEEGSGEKTPLLDQITSRQRKSPDSDTSGSVRYADINSNEATKSTASSWQVGVFLLVNTALGAGILNYPAAYDRLGGILVSTLLQVVIILMLSSTMLILVFCAELHKDNTYHDVLRSMCGRKAQQLAAGSIMCTCFGINVTFLIIIGDQFDRLLYTFIGPDHCFTFWYSRTFTIIATALITIWPMCYFKRLDFLRYVSTLGIFAMLYVVFLNIYEYYVLDVVRGEIKTSPSSTLEVVASLPVICFAYQTHEIVLPIYSSLSKPRSTNFFKSTVCSLALLFVIYTLGGTYGYLTFGGKVSADIIQMYDAKDPIVVAGIIALIIKMISTYTPLMFCGRGALDGLYAEWRSLSTEAYIKGERARRITITTFWNLAVLLLAIVTPNITIAIEMLGSLAACNVFVFPGMCMVSLAYRHLTGFYAKFNPDRKILQRLEGTRSWRCFWNFLLALGVFIILFGFGMFVIVFFQVVEDISKARQSGLETEFTCSV